MKPDIQIQTERLLIKTLSTEDAQGYSQLGVSYRSTGPLNTTEKAQAFLQKAEKDEDSFNVGIFEKNEVIGTIEVCHMKWFTRGCEIGYTVRKDKQGQGIATEAVKAVLQHVFSEMNMHKVYADTTPDNIGSQRVLEKSGFKLEGTIRDRQFKNDKWVDQLEYGILEDELKE